MLKNSLVKYSLFLVILILSDQCIGTAISYFAREQIRDNRIGLLIDGKIQADICIVGSSRALNNYSPAIIGDSLNVKCYNFGLSGSNVLYHEAIIDLLIQSYKKPSVIIYSIDDHATFFEVTNMVFRKDALFPYVHNSTVNEIVCKQMNKKEYATLFSKTYRQNMNLVNALKYPVYGKEVLDYKTNNLDSMGANLLAMRPADPPTVFRSQKLRADKWHINLKFWAAFRRIQEKCSENNIRLVFVLPPIYTTGFPGFNAIVNAAVIGKSPVFDYTHTFRDPGLFFNPDHLNKVGASDFSRLLVNDIKKLDL